MKLDEERKIELVLEKDDEVFNDMEVKKDGLTGAHIPMSKRHIGKKAFVILSDHIDYPIKNEEREKKEEERQK